MKIIENTNEHFIANQKVYFKHGQGNRTLVILGSEALCRAFVRKNIPLYNNLVVNFSAFNLKGLLLITKDFVFSKDQEIYFDSSLLFNQDDSILEGSILISVKNLEFDTIHANKIDRLKESLNGVILIYKANSFITGVHSYHDALLFSKKHLLKHNLRNFKILCKNRFRNFRNLLLLGSSRSFWKSDATGASVTKSSSTTSSFAIFHTDNFFPGVFGRIERRINSKAFSRHRLPSLNKNSTCKFLTKNDLKFNEKWTNILLPTAPAGVSRFLTGEEFQDGSICIDHTYFQHTRDTIDTKVINEVKYFKKSILEDKNVIGPSHPWPLIHNKSTSSLIAFSNQLYPDEPKFYDLLVYDCEGKLVLEKLTFIELEPYGTCVKSVSDELIKIGIEDLEGCYLLKHSSSNPNEDLPNRIHGQGIYMFNDKYWNAVQSDASIWSSPSTPIPEIEALSSAKVRRKQYWYAPIIHNDSLDTIIALHNLSYHKQYNLSQVLCLRLSTGNKIISEKEVTLKPFASRFINASLFFKEELNNCKSEVAHITVYPKTGITYCGSFIVKEKGSGTFMLEHFLKVPKYKHEVNS